MTVSVNWPALKFPTAAADFGGIDFGVVERFATGFLDHIAQRLALLFEVPLKIGSARAENVNWFVHSWANLGQAKRAVIPSRRSAASLSGLRQAMRPS
jgi:hypothetical protein